MSGLSQPEIKKEIKILAERYNLPIKVIESIILVYFKQVIIGMEEADKTVGNYPVISIPYLGKFVVKETRREKLTNLFKTNGKKEGADSTTTGDSEQGSL